MTGHGTRVEAIPTLPRALGIRPMMSIWIVMTRGSFGSKCHGCGCCRSLKGFGYDFATVERSLATAVVNELMVMALAGNVDVCMCVYVCVFIEDIFAHRGMIVYLLDVTSWVLQLLLGFVCLFPQLFLVILEGHDDVGNQDNVCHERRQTTRVRCIA